MDSFIALSTCLSTIKTSSIFSSSIPRSGTRTQSLFCPPWQVEELRSMSTSSVLSDRDSRRGAASSILEAIGNTPVVELRRLNSHPNVRLFAKLEGANPSGSVKDRVAKYLVEEFEGR